MTYDLKDVPIGRRRRPRESRTASPVLRIASVTRACSRAAPRAPTRRAGRAAPDPSAAPARAPPPCSRAGSCRAPGCRRGCPTHAPVRHPGVRQVDTEPPAFTRRASNSTSSTATSPSRSRPTRSSAQRLHGHVAAPHLVHLALHRPLVERAAGRAVQAAGARLGALPARQHLGLRSSPRPDAARRRRPRSAASGAAEHVVVVSIWVAARDPDPGVARAVAVWPRGTTWRTPSADEEPRPARSPPRSPHRARADSPARAACRGKPRAARPGRSWAPPPTRTAQTACAIATSPASSSSVRSGGPAALSFSSSAP